jgi:cell division protein FtsW (lipid II flippase)
VIVSRRRPQYEPVAFWLVWFAVLATLAAYFTGLAQSTEFQHRPKHWLVDTHMRWGIGLALAQCVWLLTLLRRGTRSFATVWSLVVAALVLVTAFLGGLVAHGRSAAPPPSSRAESR